MKKVGITGRSRDYEVIKNLIDILSEMNVEYVVDRDLKLVLKKGYHFKDILDMEDIDILFIIGGDGTVLRKIKRLPRTNPPILGINTGTVGFLLEVEPNQIANALLMLKERKYFIEERSKLMMKLTSGRIFEVLNEFLITSYRVGKAIELVVRKENGDKIFEGKLDGLIVSSTTGSTGHALSVGGPIIDPEVDIIMIVTIAPMTLFSRPVILPPWSTITVDILSSRCLVIGDGELIDILDEGDTVKISKASSSVKFIRFSKKFYKKIIKRGRGNIFSRREID